MVLFSKYILRSLVTWIKYLLDKSEEEKMGWRRGKEEREEMGKRRGRGEIQGIGFCYKFVDKRKSSTIQTEN